MPKSFATFVVSLVLLSLSGGAATAEEAQGYLSAAPPSFQAEATPPPLRLAEATKLTALVDMPAAELGASDSLAHLTSWNSSGNVPVQDGFVRPLSSKISIVDPPRAPEARSGGEVTSVSAIAPDGRWIWGTSIHVPASHRLRLQLTEVRFPPGTQLWVWGEAEEPRVFGLELVGPDGTLWTPSVTGPTIYVEVAVPMESESATSEPFATISGVVQIFALTADGAPILEPYPEAPNLVTSCLLNAGCYSNSGIPGIDNWKRGVAHLQFIKGGQSRICSGTLLADTQLTYNSYFLTANHCFSTQAEASTLEAYWDYIAPCGGSAPPLGSLPRSNGATLLATSANSDFTFLRLNSVPSNRYHLAWNSSPSAAPAGSFLYRLHHPLGWSMSLSGAPVASNSCPGGKPTSTHLYLDPQPELGNGATQGGSSGSSSLLANGQVVGQLQGGCGPNAADACLAATGDFDYDGRFSTTYPSISQYLSPSGGGTGPCVENAAAGTYCMYDGDRFEVKIVMNDFNQPPNQFIGKAILNSQGQPSRGSKPGFEWGLFYTFDNTNPEVMLKFLNACGLNNKIWVYGAQSTNAYSRIDIRDTLTGATKSYTNTAGVAAVAIADTNAFNCQ